MSIKTYRSDFMSNLLLQGDNLFSLRHLLNTYKNKIDIIYIDPPYNTKNPDFVYNDKYNKDEYILFMKERLELSKELMNEESIIFISIDDNQLYELKLLCDEIYGKNNFIENFIWIKGCSKNNSKTSSTLHEYILCYAKDINKLNKQKHFVVRKKGYDDFFNIVSNCKLENKTPKETEKKLRQYINANKYKIDSGMTKYKNIDENYNIYSLSDLGNPENKLNNELYTYELINPYTNTKCNMSKKGWLYKKEIMDKLIIENKIYFDSKVPRLKKYLTNTEYQNMPSIIENSDNGIIDLEKIFNKKVFDYPKPVSLIKYLINSILNKEAIVLDFFAGSGTTAQAVIELNIEDNGNRQFILCTNNENNICEKVTCERINKLIEKYNVNIDFIHTVLE
jgi:adenine-specific DNA-methyltransferase